MIIFCKLDLTTQYQVENLDALITRSIQQTEQVDIQFDRYLNEEINWNNRLIIIKGSRGVGKTTLLLKHIKQNNFKSTEVLYASLDDLWFNKYSIVQLGEWWVQQGGKKLLLDEVHKYEGWTREIKNLYDRFPKLQMVLTGSSAIEIIKGEGDLSRRSLVYTLQGLSFREFMQIENNLKLDSYTLEELLHNSTEISNKISNKHKPLQHFNNYLKGGYYPFYKEDDKGYYQRIQQVIQLVMESDIPSIQHIEYSAVQMMKKLLIIIADLVPYKPNISKLSAQVGLSRETLVKYLQYLSQAGILQMLYSDTGGISLLNKPEKIYLQNSNLAYALSLNKPEKGAVRETFAMNQLSLKHQVAYPDKGDFLVDKKYLFEIGGKQKSQQQISGKKNAFVIADDIEIALGNKIPLWMLGFLY